MKLNARHRNPFDFDYIKASIEDLAYQQSNFVIRYLQRRENLLVHAFFDPLSYTYILYHKTLFNKRIFPTIRIAFPTG